MYIHYRAPVMHCILFLFTYLMLYSALLRVSSITGVCPSGNPPVFAYYVCIVIYFAFGKINILLLTKHRLAAIQAIDQPINDARGICISIGALVDIHSQRFD